MKFTESNIFKDLEDYDLVELEIGNFYFCEEFVIAEINEGEVFTFEKSRKLFEFAFKKYKGNFFGYISNRINSYSSFPEDYEKTNNYLPSLIAFSAVTYTKDGKNFTALERKFCKVSFESFDKLEDAVQWISRIVKKARSKK